MHNGEQKDVNEIWYSADGCTVFECLSDYTVAERPKVCDPNALKKFGFSFPAPISCPASKPKLAILNPADGEGHKCCNYGKCSADVNVHVECPPLVTAEDPVCSCQYTSIITTQET